MIPGHTKVDTFYFPFDKRFAASRGLRGIPASFAQILTVPRGITPKITLLPARPLMTSFRVPSPPHAITVAKIVLYSLASQFSTIPSPGSVLDYLLPNRDSPGTSQHRQGLLADLCRLPD